MKWWVSKLAEETKQGKWIEIAYSQMYRCSICEQDIYFGKDNFCKNCGADMRKKE